MSQRRREHQARRARAAAWNDRRWVVVPWNRRELIAAALSGVIAFALQLATFSSHMALGDATEYAAGARSLGNLHSPGYPTYVLTARLFTLLLPVGSFALRVNLFSLACTVVATVLVQRLGRAAGASIAASVFGAAVYATGTSTWFYGGFAKHYALASALTAAAILFLARWHATRGRRDLLMASVLTGLLIGAGWPFAVVMTIAGIAVLVARPRPSRAQVALAIGIVALAGCMLYGFVALRASQDPQLNWGHPDSLSRMVRLLEFEDFGTGSRALGGGGTSTSGAITFSSIPQRIASYVGMAERELGLAALALAVVGVAALARRRAGEIGRLLGGVLIAELALAVVVVGPRTVRGFGTTLQQGGYLHGVWEVLAVLTALGLTEIVAQLRRAASHPKPTEVIAIAVAGAVALVPAVAVHGAQMARREPDLAEPYATMVLDALPRDAAVFVYGAERAMPLWYAQVVDHERRDVAVIATDGLALPWSRDEAARLLGPLPKRVRNTRADAVSAITAVAERRPVRLDPYTAELVHESIGFRFDGYMAEVVDGRVGAQPISDASAVQRQLLPVTKAFLNAEFRHAFPNLTMDESLARAHVELARHFTTSNQLTKAEVELRTALRLVPDYELARSNLELVLSELSR